MGWAAGSGLADEVWGIVREFVPPHKRKAIAREIIEIFEGEDADDWCGDMLIEEDADFPESEQENDEDLEDE